MGCVPGGRLTIKNAGKGEALLPAASYCLSYTAVAVIFFPAASVP